MILAKIVYLPFVAVILGVGFTSSLKAEVFVPSGLNAGDHYHLVFVTQGETTSLSNQIATYNTFVNNEAERAGSFTADWNLDWRAVGSTASVNANVNALVEAPVYLLDGTSVADGFDDLWDGIIKAPISLDQFRNGATGRVVSGASFDGGPAPAAATLGDFFVRTGEINQTIGWIAGLLEVDPNTALPMYAMSPRLTVTAVPEPRIFGCMMVISAICLYRVRRRTRPGSQAPVSA